MYELVSNICIIYNIQSLLPGGKYIPTPEKLAWKTALVNMQNTGDRCFIGAVLSALYSDSFQMTLEDASSLQRFEDSNNVSLNIFFYEDQTVIPGVITESEK